MIFVFIRMIESLGFHVPAVFHYTSTRMILAAVTSLVFCIVIGPYFIKKLYELKMGQPIRMEDCPHLGNLHKKKQDTPTMGGLLILSGVMLSWVLWIDFTAAFSHLLLITTVFVGFLGGRDDYLKLKFRNSKGLSARKKLLYQSLVALLIASYLMIPGIPDWINKMTGIAPPIIKAQTITSLTDFYSTIYFPFFKEPLVMAGIGIIFVFLFIIFVIVGSSNSVNLTDGLDGLATGCLIMVASGLAIVAFVSNNLDISSYLNIPYIEGSGEIAVFLSAFIGACIGFLWYNSPPAQVFMGDIGSLSLGAIIGVCAVLLNKSLLLGVMGGVFVAEALSVILQVLSFKYRNKKRIFLIAPLHHHFEYQGWAETKVVVRFWIIAFLLAVIGIASLKFQ